MSQAGFAKPIIAAFALAIVGVAHAADKDVEDLLSHMRDAYKGVKVATFTTESIFKGDGDKKAVFVNTFTIKDQTKLRLEITAPNDTDPKHTLIKVSDGKDIAMRLPDSKEFTHREFSVDTFESNLPTNLESFCFFDYDRQLSTATGKNMEHSALKIKKDVDWDGKKWLVLEETAQEQGVFCRYFVDPKTFFIWRTVVKQIDAEADSGDFQVKKMDLTAKVDDSVFKAG